jgi:hypothetical protein
MVYKGVLTSSKLVWVMMSVGALNKVDKVFSLSLSGFDPLPELNAEVIFLTT